MNTEIAFTGTRKGMTDKQKVEVIRFFESNSPKKIKFVRHGGCDGSDDDFHEIAQDYCNIVVHPGNQQQKEKYMNKPNVTVMEVKPFLVRNRDMVDKIEWVLATPRGFEEELRSGTWMTIRYALKQNKIVHIIFPNGKIEVKENE